MSGQHRTCGNDMPVEARSPTLAHPPTHSLTHSSTHPPACCSDIETDLRAVLAGTILTLIFNFLLIIYWGLTEHGTQALALGRGAAADAVSGVQCGVAHVWCWSGSESRMRVGWPGSGAAARAVASRVLPAVDLSRPFS